MPSKPQIIYSDGRPAFVVLPVQDYLDLSPEAESWLSDEEAFDLARDDGTLIPHHVMSRIIDGENPVKVYREFRDMTQEQLAESANVSPGYISQVERGTRHLSAKLQMKLAGILRIESDDLE